MSYMTAVGLAPATLVKLIQHFENRQEEVDLAVELTAIVETWLADRASAARFADKQGIQAVDVPRGYHWKELFLPHGTRLRLYLNGPDDEAVVVGNQLMFEGVPTSPNKFVSRYRHLPCNAWEYLSVLFPGERKWVRANHLRRSHAGPRDRRSKSPQVQGKAGL